MFSMIQQKAPAIPMQYASAYTPPCRPNCPAGSATCPVNGSLDADTLDEEPVDTEREREVQDLQADIQRHVNDIKQTHWRWLPGRFASARRQMLRVAGTSCDGDLAQSPILEPLWPPVARSKDLAKHSATVDMHGHVLAIKLWTKAVLFVCRYNASLPVAHRDRLCQATLRIVYQASHAHRGMRWYDRWRLQAAHRHIADMRQKLQASDHKASGGGGLGC